jgi:BON domain
MRAHSRRCVALFGMAGLLLLTWVAESDAQARQGGGSGSSVGGGQTGGGGPGGGGTLAPQEGFGLTSGFSLEGSVGGRSAGPYKMIGATSNYGVGGPVGQFYANPLSYGLPGANRQATFGVPLYQTGAGGSLGVGGGQVGGGGMRTGQFGTGGNVGGSFGGATGGRLGSQVTASGTRIGGGSSAGVGLGGSSLGGSSFGGSSFGGTGARQSFGGSPVGLTPGATAAPIGGFGPTGTTPGMGQTALGQTRGVTGAPGTFGTPGTVPGAQRVGTGTQMQAGRTGTGVTPNTARRSVPYYVVVAPTMPVQTPTAAVSGGLAAEVKGVITRSTALRSNGDIQVGAQGSEVVLKGTVADDRQRQLAEALIRLTPGVREVRNELQVRETVPPPMPVPNP